MCRTLLHTFVFSAACKEGRGSCAGGGTWGPGGSEWMTNRVLKGHSNVLMYLLPAGEQAEPRLTEKKKNHKI